MAVLKRPQSMGDLGHGFDRRRRYEHGEAVFYADQGAAAMIPQTAELDPMRLLTRIHDVEGAQRELTLNLTHMTQTVSGAVSSLKDEIQRLSEIGERQVEQNARAQDRRDITVTGLAQQAAELRGAIKALGVVGFLLISIAAAYFQLQVNTVVARIDHADASIQELQRK